MKICILHPSYTDSDSPTQDLDPDCNPSIYTNGHLCENVILHKVTARQQIAELASRDFDVFLNLCDGAEDENRPGIEVVLALEEQGAAFTGASSHFYDPTRQEMKGACQAAGVKTPAGVFAYTKADIGTAAASLQFPLIVKHHRSYASIGLTRDSRVENPAALQIQAGRILTAFSGALIEEFIEGREFTVLIVENSTNPLNPVVYPPLEFIFPEGESFKHFDMKWVEYSGMVPVLCDVPDLSARMSEIARKVFLGLGGAGYARCDLRMDSQGELWFLEINPNCGVFYPPEQPGSADLILLNGPGGHREFVELILQAAVQRSWGKRGIGE